MHSFLISLSRLAVALFLLAGCQATGVPEPSPPAGAKSEQIGCKDPDNLNRVSGNELCLVIKTWAPEPSDSASTLLVFLHGDVSKGCACDVSRCCAADYQYRAAKFYASSEVVAVAMLRPGYYDRAGNRSTGDYNCRRDNYTHVNIDAIAAALQTLKEYHKVEHLVVLGHSGGANIAGVILGRRPGLIDGAVLVSCACDIPRWRRDRRRQPWPRSLSAHNYIIDVPEDTTVVAITGEKDRNTKPYLARAYVRHLRESDVKNATFVRIPNAVHGFSSMFYSVPFRKAVDGVLKAVKAKYKAGAHNEPVECSS